MVKILLLNIFTCLLLGSLNAQIVLEKDFEEFNIEPMVQYLTNDKQIDRQSILNGQYDKSFENLSENIKLLDSDSLWLKWEVKNPLPDEKLFYIGTSRFDYIEFFERKDSTIKGPFISGAKIEPDKRAVQVPGFSFFEISLKSGEQKTFYLFLRNETLTFATQNRLPLTLMSDSFFENHHENPGNYTYMFIGAALIMVFFNLLLFILTKIRAYFFYTAYIVNVTLFALALIPQFALPIFGHMDVNEPPISYCGIFSQFFYILVAREILEIPRLYPKIDKILRIILGLLALSAILNLLIGNQIVSTIINYSTVLFSYPTLFGLGAILMWRGHLAGRYFFLASSFYFTSVIIMVFQLLGTLPSVIFGLTYSSIVEIGIAAELALFGLGLGVRINEMRKRVIEEELEKEKILREKEEEKKSILEEQNRSLEIKVKERTSEVESQKAALEKSLEDLKKAQYKLIESEKMASLGQLTAGVAHEINNPVNFISNGVTNLRANFNDIVNALKNYLDLKPENVDATALQNVIDKNANLDVNDAMEDSEYLFTSINNGVDRTVSIVKSLRNFSRLDEGEFKLVDLHEGLESTLEILQSQIKKRAVVIKNYGQIPKLLCMPGKINQAFLNIINNALQAMETMGELTISTEHDIKNDLIIVKIKDTGKGMDEATKSRLFEPFFTTKPVGEGTGLGLAITYGIIEDHKGKIQVESTPGVGTTFAILFPINAFNPEES
ncbi:MAG: ATP-binding protein [Saprospiraceae bacterium]